MPRRCLLLFRIKEAGEEKKLLSNEKKKKEVKTYYLSGLDGINTYLQLQPMRNVFIHKSCL